MRAKDDSDWYGASARDTSRARAAGLLTRPPQQTLPTRSFGSCHLHNRARTAPASPTRKNKTCSTPSHSSIADPLAG